MADIPHFSVTTVAGDKVDYSRIWQQRQLALVALPRTESPEAADYITRVRNALAPLSEDTAVVITRDDIPGFPAPAAVIADRWGEIAHSVRTGSIADLPSGDELREWIEHVRQRCPECEGEAH